MPDKYVTLECAPAAAASDLSDVKTLGKKVEFDFGCGGHVHVTPHDGEGPAEVLARAERALKEIGHDPDRVSIDRTTWRMWP